MRITKDLLLRFANDAVRKRVDAHRSSLLAAYLHGSVNDVEFDPLGGITDIDLVFVWEVPPPDEREFVRLTDEIHLDITHHPRSIYRSPRELRTDPWMGPTIYGFKILHDPSHILDFAQASVRDRFFEPTNVMERSRKLAGRARDTWMSFMTEPSLSPESATRFLSAVADAANAIALMDGRPLAERSFLKDFYGRAGEQGKPELYLRLVETLGGGDVSTDDLTSWLPDWLDAITERNTGNIPRIIYHHKAAEALLASERPPDALWPILWQWTQAALDIDTNSPAEHKWKDAFKKTGAIGERFEQRMASFDIFLDIVEEVLDTWSRTEGIS
jgi:hypothetical protein